MRTVTVGEIPMASAQQAGEIASKKRKIAESSTNQPRKKYRYDRVISAQSASKYFVHGEIDVGKFVKAREYEIKALEDAIKQSRNSTATRAFQEVPRSLRRRTGSHNVKRIPKRLRVRARREMKEDKTPIKKKKNVSRSLHFRLENVKKLQSISSKAKKSKSESKSEDAMDIDVEKNEENLDQISSNSRKPKVKKSVLREPPQPKAKFRKRQIEKTWLPTHLYHSKRAHMTPPKEPLWKFAIPLTPTEKSYRQTHRATTTRGAVAWDMSYMSTIGLQGMENSVIGLLKTLGVGSDAKNEIIWGRAGKNWREGLRSWHGWLYRRQEYPLGAIGPATVLWCPEDSTRASHRRVFIRTHPSCFMMLWEEVIRLAKIQKPSISVEDLRFEIGSIDITGSNATEALIGLLQPNWRRQEGESGQDRLKSVWDTLGCCSAPSILPRNVVLAFEMSDPRLHYPPRKLKFPKDASQTLLEMCANWPLERSDLDFSLFNRVKRQDAVNALPTQKAINRRKSDAPPAEYPKPLSSDPKIPILLLVDQGGGSDKGSWTVLLPWNCVKPVWSTLLHFPLSSGGNVRFGGLREMRQTSYEAGKPWYPADFPGTVAGMEWELREREKAKADWHKKPKGKRVEFDGIDLGLGRLGEIGEGWACHWERLLSKSLDLENVHIPYSIARQALIDGSKLNIPNHGLATAKVAMVATGVPHEKSRIYRLPTNNPELRRQWLSQLPKKGTKNQKPDDVGHPAVPDEGDLIGFITSGNFNLVEGSGIGIGSLQLSKVIDAFEGNMTEVSLVEKESLVKSLCIIRPSGQTTGRLAKWELV